MTAAHSSDNNANAASVSARQSRSAAVPQLARALDEFKRLLHEDPEYSGTGDAEAWTLLVHALPVLIDSLEQRSREPNGELHVLRSGFPIAHSGNLV